MRIALRLPGAYYATATTILQLRKHTTILHKCFGLPKISSAAHIATEKRTNILLDINGMKAEINSKPKRTKFNLINNIFLSPV